MFDHYIQINNKMNCNYYKSLITIIITEEYHTIKNGNMKHKYSKLKRPVSKKKKF